jgi:diaminopimelate epimerase
MKMRVWNVEGSMKEPTGNGRTDFAYHVAARTLEGAVSACDRILKYQGFRDPDVKKVEAGVGLIAVEGFEP